MSSNIKLQKPERRSPDEYFVKTNTRIFYDHGTDKKLDCDEFMSIFCARGSFRQILSKDILLLIAKSIFNDILVEIGELEVWGESVG